MRDIRIQTIIDDHVHPPQFPYISTREGFVKIPFLRKPGIEFDHTEEEIKNIIQLKNDPSYLSTFLNIWSKSGSVNFNLYPAQKEFIDNYQTSKFNLIKQSRQVGISSMLSLIMLHYSLTRSSKDIFYISPSTSWKEDFNRFISFLNQVPFYMSVGVSITEKQNLKSIDFENGSRITFTDTLTKSFSSVDFLIVDQAAFLDLGKILTIVTPRLMSTNDTQCFISSSPKSGSNFNTIFKSGGMWNKIILNWDIVPERDSNWVTETSYLLGGFQNFLDEYHVDDSIDKIRDLKIDLLNL